MNQADAFDLLKTGCNTFLTGEAGAGKTYLLNKYISYLKDNNVAVAITASTGIAATHLQGTTIHSWSGIGVKNHLTDKDLDKLLANSRIKRNYKKTKVLIIDEISMLHGFQLNMVDQIARYMNGSEKPFGGIQVVLCGDFFQLPPVSSSSEFGETQFAFESSAWLNGDFQTCYLDEQHRQKNDPLLQVLKDIRSGTAGEHTKVPLRTRYKKEPEGNTKPTKLYARNINVDTINNFELAQISGEEKVFSMQHYGFGTLVDGLKKSCLAPEELRLKLGAQVMFIKNDQLGNYANGTRGVVVNFTNKDSHPVVESYDGNIIIAKPEDWNYEDNGTVRATITQIPLRLAWAITIHKSQGMTLDAAEMDLGDTFEPGMGYVALSRVRSLSGLKLINLNEMALKVHPKILEQDIIFKEQSYDALDSLKKMSKNDKEEIQEKILQEKLEAGSAPKAKKKSLKEPKEKKPETHMVTYQMLHDNLSISEIAVQRELTVGTIVNHIEKLRGLKVLDNSDISHLKNILPLDDFDNLVIELKKSDDGKLGPIYEKFDGKYSYDDIRIARLFAA